MLTVLIGIAVVVFAIIVLFVTTYTVVNPNEAHVVVFMGRSRKIYSSVGENKSAYFFLPILMKRFELPLTNVKMEINDIHLNDMQVAPFICDVATWLHILDPIVAAERLTLNQPFASLREDLVNIVQAVARAVAMKQEVLEIMRDREKFSSLVSAEVGTVLAKWGIELVNLEVNDIRDDQTKDSTVIYDYEQIRKKEVESISRQKVSEQERAAIEVEQENMKLAEIAKAEAQEAATKRHVVKDREIGIAQQDQIKQVATCEEEANNQKVLAQRTLDVGLASVEKEAVIEKALGESEAIRIEGEKRAEVTRLQGNADGSAIEAKGYAEASAKDKMAEAMQKFNDAATGVEKIRAWIEVEKAKWAAHGKVAENANIDIVNSGKGASILGVPLNAESGADLGQMLKGLDLGKIGKLLKGLKDDKSNETKE